MQFLVHNWIWFQASRHKAVADDNFSHSLHLHLTDTLQFRLPITIWLLWIIVIIKFHVEFIRIYLRHDHFFLLVSWLTEEWLISGKIILSIVSHYCQFFSQFKWHHRLHTVQPTRSNSIIESLVQSLYVKRGRLVYEPKYNHDKLAFS